MLTRKVVRVTGTSGWSPSRRGAWKPFLCLALLAALWCAPALAAEGDWPQWRGPARDGYAPVAGNESLAAALQGPLPSALHQVWKVEVGLGQSAPIIHQGRLYIHVRQGEDEVVLALDPETGEEIWRYGYPVPYVEVNHASAWGPGPKSTLTAVGDTLYTFGVTERLHAIDAEQGDVRWDKNYDDIYKQPYPECGTSASPLVEGDLLIVPIGQTWPDPSLESLGELVAYNRLTGQEVWRTEKLPPGYASAMAFTIEGVRQIVTTTQNHVVGIRASDGKTLWKKEMRIFMEQNIPTPVLYDGKVLIGGYHWGNALLDFEPGAGDELWDVDSVWATKRHEMYMDSPVLVGDYVYFRSHKRLGTMVCVDIRTGEQCWQGPPQAARYAAFVVVGEDRLLVLTDNGDIKVLAADPSEYQELASWEVADTPVFTHLTVAGSRMYVKDEAHLAVFEIAADQVTEAPDSPADAVVADAWTPTPEDKGAALEAVNRLLDTRKEATSWEQVEEHLSYWAEDFSDYSGQTKADWVVMYRNIFDRIGRIGSPLGFDSESMYVEWLGETAVVRGIFIDFRPRRQAIMEQFYMVKKYGDRWLVNATDNRPIWERWAEGGEFKSTAFGAETDQ